MAGRSRVRRLPHKSTLNNQPDLCQTTERTGAAYRCPAALLRVLSGALPDSGSLERLCPPRPRSSAPPPESCPASPQCSLSRLIQWSCLCHSLALNTGWRFLSATDRGVRPIRLERRESPENWIKLN